MYNEAKSTFNMNKSSDAKKSKVNITGAANAGNNKSKEYNQK